MPASADTILRRLRRMPLPPRAALQVLAVDDWAIRNGQTKDTILVDLHARRVVDLLPDRSGMPPARWLGRRPAVALVTRDRSTEDARAMTAALPTATQVADRRRLLRNAL
jgi:transposase